MLLRKADRIRLGELIEVDENDVTYCQRRGDTEGKMYWSFSQLMTENFVCAHKCFLGKYNIVHYIIY